MRRSAEGGFVSIRFVVVVALTLAGFLSAALAGLIPGKGNKKSGCYVELDVQGVEPNTSVIQKNGKQILCTDGDPCDSDGQCNNKVLFKVQACINQKDPNLPECTPANEQSGGGLKKVTIPNKFNVAIPQLLTASTCSGAFVDIETEIKLKKNGKPKKKVVTKKLKATAKGEKGTKPKSATNNYEFSGQYRDLATNPCPTTTVTSTTTTTTLQCLACSGFSQLNFQTGVGAASCGDSGMYQHCSFGSPGTDGNGSCTTANDCAQVGDGETCVGTPPSPPPSGETRASNNAVLANLGRSCLYLGGGDQLATPPSSNPDGSSLQMQACCNAGNNTQVTLAASATGSKVTCTKGAGPGKKCQNGDEGADGQGTCSTDADCLLPGQTLPLVGACAPDANCFFGPPLPIPSSLSTCTLNVIATDASGTVDPTTGQATMTIPLSSRVYLTGNFAAPCPQCINNQCVGGANNGGACTPVGLPLPVGKQTTHECPPSRNLFVGALPVTLQDLTTGTSTKTADANGFFCPLTCTKGTRVGQPCTTVADCPESEPGQQTECKQQVVNGAFGSVYNTTITETGSAAGSLLDMMPHAGRLGGVFCVPASGNAAIDGSASLPGPGATSLPGLFSLLSLLP